MTTDTVVQAFDAFAETYAGKYQETKVPCFVVLDNASIHRSGAFKEKVPALSSTLQPRAEPDRNALA